MRLISKLHKQFYLMPMKQVYTLFYSLNNVENEQNYLLKLSEIEENERFIKKALNSLEFSPRKGIIDNLLKHAREA